MKPWQKRLLAWFEREKRDLPWRARADAYSIWVSEVMLQQTQVKTVLPYYGAFLKRFPTVRALAAAPERDVLARWAGLGYYRRARNLHKAAKLVAREHGGRFPATLEGLRALPGLGRYSAAAVGSLAFGLRAAVVDGNVVRVLSRLFALRGDPAKAMDRYWDLAQSLIPAKRGTRNLPGDWNEAVMELGAVVCLPRAPLCAVCPVRAACAAAKRGLQDSLPQTPAQRDSVDVRLTFLLARRGGGMLLEKRPERGLLAGHWGLPGLTPDRLSRVRRPRLLGAARHSITHHRVEARLLGGTWSGRLPANWRWTADGEAGERLVSSLWRKLLAAAGPDKKPKK